MTELSNETPVEEPRPALVFSAGCLAFYDTAIWPHALPHDAVEVDALIHADLMENLSAGQVLAADLNGHPVAVPPPEPSAEVLANRMRQQRDSLIGAVQWLIERHRGEVELSRPTALTSSQHLQLLQYVQDLRDVPAQTGFPTTITWPVAPDVTAL